MMMKLKSIILASSLLLVACQKEETELYKVTAKDAEGYYHASKLVEAEDHTLVPVSFYGDQSEVVFLPENIQGSGVEVGEKVSISLDENGENPQVKEEN
jgi:hypothetical protein